MRAFGAADRVAVIHMWITYARVLKSAGSFANVMSLV